MSYRRGRFGVEYRPEPPSEETPWLLWAIVLVVLVALGYGSLAAYRKVANWLEQRPAAAPELPAAVVAKPSVPEPNVSAPRVTVTGERPRKVKNLLMKLDQAIATTNYPLQVAVIEELRALPGAPAADLDDSLARSLGRLNLRILFDAEHKNEWVKRVEVKRGNSASRIASEWGTTLKCVEKLNGDVSTIHPGTFLWVMNHPQFRLSVFRKTRIADLSLNNKFFKRYYLTDEVRGANGSYVFPVKIRTFFAEYGVWFKDKDLVELEMLLPKGANMTIADFR